MAVQPTMGAGTPDWGAMAERHDSKRKRRRTLIITVCVVGVLAVAGGVGALLLSGHSGGTPTAGHSAAPVPGPPSPSGSPSGSTPQPGPSISGSLPPARGSIPLALGTGTKVVTMAGTPGQSLSLPSGQDSFAQSTATVIDTSKSFTVSLRVYCDEQSGNRVAVSQGSGQFYSFWVGRVLSGTNNHWEFKVQTLGGGSTSVLSRGTAATSQWATLTAVYDAAQHRIQLYVNGALSGSARIPGIAGFPGGLQLGRVRSDSQWSDPWHGDVSAVQVWNQALTAADAATVAAQPDGPLLKQAASAWLSG
ncbi:LamG domain-containing protein [Streptacidiphilus sp. 4-A2]|nr:LamG domain-containing protein [Streptacidiphilus sp. 4-A2]